MVFAGISINNSIVLDFNQNVTQFLEVVGVDFNGFTIGQHVYKVRNVLVHNMRRVIDYECEFNAVVECFEKLIALRLDREKSEFKDKHMVVCDISENFKKNKRRMRLVYNSYKNGK